MIVQRPKRKKAKPVKKTSVNANQSGSLAPSHALPNGPQQVAPQQQNSHHGRTRNGNLRLPFQPNPLQSLPQASLSSKAGTPRAPIIVPYFSPPPLPPPFPPPRLPPPAVPNLFDSQGVAAGPHRFDQEPALYDLICSKFDAVITSIDEESFSGDRRELGW